MSNAEATLESASVRNPVFGGLFIYAKLIETGTLSWTLAAASFVLGALSCCL
jgi:hypothetical protein